MRKRGFELLLLLTILFLTPGCGMVYYWLATPTEISVIVPEGFEGRVLIAWSIPDGEAAEISEDGVLTLRLQPDGALLLRNERPSYGRESFWYEHADGSLTRIPWSSCFDDSPQEGIVVCSDMEAVLRDSRLLYPNTAYNIGTVEAIRTRDFSQDDVLLEKYMSRLLVPTPEDQEP